MPAPPARRLSGPGGPSAGAFPCDVFCLSAFLLSFPNANASGQFSARETKPHRLPVASSTKSPQHVGDGALARLRSSDQGMINEGAALFGMTYVPLVFEDTLMWLARWSRL